MDKETLVYVDLQGTPYLVGRLWAEADGTFFGIVDNWYSCIAEGWEDAIEPLIAIQKGLDIARDKAIAEKSAHKPPAAGLAFTHARVLEVEKGKWIDDQTVVAAVRGGLLTLEEACTRYALDIDELIGWQRAVGRSGIKGLRVTRLQQYREMYEKHDRY